MNDDVLNARNFEIVLIKITPCKLIPNPIYSKLLFWFTDLGLLSEGDII